MPFDMTRIHPKQYGFALKISRDAFKDKFSDD
jgi:hypothetical protein